MLQYKSPGVYIEEINTLPRSIAAVETAIPVFIGRTNVDPANLDFHRKPTRILSMLDYVNHFGTAPAQEFEIDIKQNEDLVGQITNTEIELKTAVTTPSHYMFYALQLYFTNGGGPCYIMSTGSYTADVHKDDYKQEEIFAVLEEYDEPTLIVMPEAPSLGNDYYPIVESALNHCAKMQDRFLICDVANAIVGGTDTNAKVTTNFRGEIPSDGSVLKYGAGYFPYLKTKLSFVFEDTDVIIKSHTITKEGGGAVTAPEITADDTLDTIINTHNELYYGISDFVEAVNVVLPPSSSMAGIYAKVDKTHAVWKAPANISVSGIVGPVIKVTQDMNDGLNVDATGKSVNPIRDFTGKGSLVWGGRTLNAGDLNWRFINVRREVIFIEESIKKALEHYVFEPNTANTWVKVKTMITAFLTNIWKAGGLAGGKAEDAFEVNIGVNITMTPLEVAEGIMIVEVILVPPRPAEVIIIRVSQKLQVS